MDSKEKASCSEKKYYKILKEEDIRQLQENHISRVSSILSVPRGVACTLLCRKNWNPHLVFDEWFTHDERESEPVGVLAKQEPPTQVCKICYEEISSANMVRSAACGHPFCADCWKTHIAACIKDGPGCLTLLCPEPTCKLSAGLELVDSLASADDKYKYYEYLYRSYIERSRNWRKWCPASGCDLAIKSNGISASGNYDVTCDCSHKFCWKCLEERHSPVDCKTVANWLEKSRAEGENTLWILAYTKPCPKCFCSIQKDGGCDDVTCPSSCRFNFCWACLEPWQGHKVCDKDKVKDVSIDEKSRMHAKRYPERYAYYYERWHSNDKSRKRALVDLNQARNEYILLEFVTEAWKQIVGCRRVLKWTYAYGYYLSLEENSRNKMNFFEYLQGEAEAALERLQYCAEKEMDKYLHSIREDFVKLQSKLASLTLVARKYFERLVRSLENNLSEIKT